MKNKIYLLFLIGFVLQSCSSSIKTNIIQSYDRIDENQEIIILRNHNNFPDEVKKVGDIKAGDTGFSTKCDYAYVMAELQNNARKSGANIINITEEKDPNFGSTCYRVKADLFRTWNPNYLNEIKPENNTVKISNLPENADYAVIYFYRKKGGAGPLIGYEVKDEYGDGIGKIRTNTKFKYVTKDFGNRTFTAQTEHKEVLEINVEKGGEYFVQCTVNMGVMIAQPNMNLVDSEKGRKDYEMVEKVWQY